MTTSLLTGLTITLVQDEVYALPAKVVLITSDIEVEVSLDGSTWLTLTDADSASGAFTGAVFIRCIVGDALVSCKSTSEILAGTIFSSITTTDFVHVGTELLLGPTETGMTVPSDGVIRMFDSTGTGFNRLEFGGSTSATVSLRASGTILDVVLGDVSNYSTMRALEFSSQNATYLMRSGIAWTNFEGVAGGTLLNAPSVGDPVKWIAIDDAGTPLFVPAWSA